MTFEQFQATRTDCNDLGAALADARWEDETVPAKGNLYLGCLYIEAVQPHWPETSRKLGKWHLIIGRDEYITDDLESLERRLFDFAVSEGFTVETEEMLCAEFKSYLTAQGLPQMSADELLHEELTTEQRRYISAFYDRWEAMLAA